jgi:L-2,4-diaminobutyrate decarboxylase
LVNLVGRSLGTSRRFDAATVVASLRTVGRRGMASKVEHLVELTEWCASEIVRHPTLELVGSGVVLCVFDVPGATSHDLRLVQ